MHFLGIRWDNSTKKPSVRYKQSPNQGDELYTPLTYGTKITFKIAKERRCIGYYIPPHYTKAHCPDNTDVLHSHTNQCPRCRAIDATHFLPVDILSPEQKENLKALKYYTYINLFGTDLIKIGVAADTRKYTRILEQGAFATMIIAEGDGYNTRKVEDYISRALKIRQSVIWATKMKLLSKAVNDKQSFEILDQFRESIHEILAKHYNTGVKLMNEYQWLYDYYNLPLPLGISEIRYVDSLNPDDTVSGKILGVYGEVLLLQNSADTLYALNMKCLLGYSIELHNDEDTNMSMSPSIQYKTMSAVEAVLDSGGLF